MAYLVISIRILQIMFPENQPLLNLIIGFLTAVSVSGLVFFTGNSRIRKYKRRIVELEKEMMHSDREIRYLEEQLVKRIRSSNAGTPVISMPAPPANPQKHANHLSV